MKKCIFEKQPPEPSCSLSNDYMTCFKAECPIWTTMKMVEKIADKERLLKSAREGDKIKLEDLNSYAMEDLTKYCVGTDIFEDPEGRKYEKRECNSEVCAQGSNSCNCQGSGYRFKETD